jgi:serine/threonine protein kinase/Ca2+-binding EF-hand superfamily protein
VIRFYIDIVDMGCGSSSQNQDGVVEVKASQIMVELNTDAEADAIEEEEKFDLDRFRPKSGAKLLDVEDYGIVSYLQEGGMGKVYKGVCKVSGQKVALKFFGYTVSHPHMDDIYAEIEVMDFLNGTPGIIGFYGILLDDRDGYIEHKHFKFSYPVIVMELIEGGELSERIYNNSSVSEKYLAKIFKQVANILVELGRRRIIHRDIKLENIMLLNKDDDDSPIKLIDFGLMVHLPDNSEQYISYALKGTNGCFAPESVIESVYSAQTDIWQAGCTLYSMLSGLAPFDPDKMHQITHGAYFEMTGVGWDNISESAKNLVSRTLQKDPKLRITAAEILTHPWIISEAPDRDLGADYALRVKQLALRQKLRSFFLDHNITRSYNDTRDKIRAALPFLNDMTDDDHDSETDAKTEDYMAQGPPLVERSSSSKEFNFKLKTLKKVIVGSWSKHNSSKIKSDGDIQLSDAEKRMLTARASNGENSGSMSGSMPIRHRAHSCSALSTLPVLQEMSSRNLEAEPEEKTECTENLSPLSLSRDELKRSISVGRRQSGNGNSGRGNRTKGSDRPETREIRRASSGGEFDIDRITVTRRGSASAQSIYHGHHTGRGLVASPVEASSSGGSVDDGDDNMYYTIPPGEIAYATFREVMRNCGLTELSELSVFNIFDSNKSGSINMREFLLTILAFKPNKKSDDVELSDEDSAAKLYFQIFDIEETGYISLVEMKLAMTCLLSADDGGTGTAAAESTEAAAPQGGEFDSRQRVGSEANVPEMEALFEIMDVDKTGRISYDEFKSFYHAVLHHSVRKPTVYPDNITPLPAPP